VTFAFDGEPSYRVVSCQECGRTSTLVTAFVTQDGTARAVVFAAIHRHDGSHEAWLDVTIGSFVEPDFADNVTFSCRVRADGATLVSGLVAGEGRAEFFGNKLSRESALSHPAVSTLWKVVDFVVTSEPTVSEGVYAK
jgi:hypothetical protein